MPDNQPSPQPQSSFNYPQAPTVTLPPRSSVDSFSTGGLEVSRGPLTLVSSFFAENDPDSNCRSFSQLLAGATSYPTVVPNFKFDQNRPGGLVVSSQQPGMFTIPPGLSPASLLDSPGFFLSNLQGPPQPGISSHQRFLAQSQMLMQSEYPSQQQNIPPPPMAIAMAMPDDHHNINNESSKISSSSSNLFNVVDKPADDGYNWRKYGQKQVKGAEYPRSYYKCTHANCPVKKKVERSHDAQITEIIYKGQHNHPPPPSRRTARDHSDGTIHDHSDLLGLPGNDLNKPNESGNKDRDSSQVVTPERVSGSSDSEEVGHDDETRVNGRDHEDEPDSKRRNMTWEQPSSSSHRTVTEPRIIVQTTSEVDLLDDGYRWRKYGQKVVKGNPYPRSYYKCTNPGCKVRKHVERAPSDPKAVITTYEGKHNHDVPAAKSTSSDSAATNITQMGNRRMETFGNNEQKPVALLRFKEEQTT